MVLNDYIRREVKEIILYIFIGIFFALILPLVGGFVLKGFQENISTGLLNISSYLGTFLIYLFFIVGSLFLIIYPIADLLVIRKGEHPATQSNPSWFRIFTVSFIFNPEDGALWRLSEYLGLSGKRNFMRWSSSMFRVFIICILIFGGLGILQVLNPSFNVVGVPNAQELQQITPASDIIFSSAIPSFAENGIFLFVLFLLLGVDAYFCAKFIKDKNTALFIFFVIALLIISPFMSLGFMSFHKIVYGNSEASLIATFVFALINSWLTILTGIFFFFLIWHFMNNFFIKLSEIVTIKEDIILFAVVIWIVLLISYITGEVLVHKYRKKRAEVNVPQ